MNDGRRQWLWTGTIGVALLFALYSNGAKFLENQTLRRDVHLAEVEAARLAQQKAKLKALVAFYESPSYQEVEARRRLGLKKPDEKVVSIKGLTEESVSNILAEIYQTPPARPTSQSPPWRQWWDYYFMANQ